MCFPFCFDCQEARTQNGSLTLLILKAEIVISVYKLSPDLSLFYFHLSHCLDFHFISISQILSGRGENNHQTKHLFQKERNSINVSFIGTQSGAAAAAAKLYHSCPTLCNPMDSSPPGYSVSGILQARLLEWVAVSFSNA